MPGAKGKNSEQLEGIRRIASDDELNHHLKGLGPDRLIIVYFSLPWCGSCQKMNPAVESLCNKYGEEASFLQVNADKCPASTKKHHVTKVPVFLLFNNRIRVDRVEGASPSELESKIRRNLADIHFQAQGLIPQPQPLMPVVTQAVKMADVTPYFNKSQCRCINDLIPTPFSAFIDGHKLISGKGIGRMILVYAFKEKMVITGFKIKAPVFSAPKILRFFVNLHKVLDFNVVSQMSSSVEVSLGESDINGDHAVDFKAGGIVGVQNLQIYVSENMTKNRRTEIDSLTLLGAPLALTGYANSSHADAPSIVIDTRSVPSDVGGEQEIISEYTQATPSEISPRAGAAGPFGKRGEAHVTIRKH